MYLELTTNGGAMYRIRPPNGRIERTDTVMSPTGKWRVMGLLRKREPKHEWVAIEQLFECIPDDLEGYKVVDFDHGAITTWPTGIAHITRIT